MKRAQVLYILKSSDHKNKLHNGKAVEVNIKPKYRRKGINVNFTMKKNVALSPLPFLCQNVRTSPLKSGLTSGYKKNYLLTI